MNSAKFWTSRFGERVREIVRYGKYMFNDHLLFVLIIAIGGGAYYYQDWVQGLTSDFPTAILFAIVFTFILTTGSVITFLKEPDKVFLLPLETTLKSYIARSAVLTYVWHVYIMLMALLLVAPIYTKTMGAGLLQLAILLLVLKFINLRVRWKVDYDADQSTVLIDYACRLLINGAVIFLYIEQSTLLFMVVAIIYILYATYFEINHRNKVLPWERLISNEEARMGRFYRLANLFTDVPQLRNEIKRRKVFDILMKGIPFAKDSTYSFLLLRTFFRSGDYFGLFLRLMIIGLLLIFGFSGSYIGIAIAVLFIYLTGFQLLNLWRHHEAVLWLEIYPVSQSIKTNSFLKLLLNILWTENLIFTLGFMTSTAWVRGLLLFAVSSLFIYAFVYIYGKNRIKKWETTYD